MINRATFTRYLPYTPEDRITYALIAAWVLSMITLPIARWTFGDQVIPIGVNLSAVLQACAVFFIVQQRWGLRRTGLAFVVVAIVTWGAEVIGSSTGFPFGIYEYTDVLQPQVAHVPLLIPAAWFMLLPSSWVMAQLIVGEKRHTWPQRLAFGGVSAVALTAWDLFLDPQMVSWNFWQWAENGAYFGIPLQNYFGWLLVAAIVTLLVNPARLPIFPLVLIYGTVCCLQTIGQAVFWGQPGPALFGFLGMGGVMLVAYLRWRASAGVK
jgi:lycopene beta-cyclase